jgi:hypothetical protein
MVTPSGGIMDQSGSHTLIRGNQPAADRMRELLARTVQDQFTDQRSNAGALEDIRQRMEGLEWLVKEVREREVPGMTAQLDELGRRLDESTQKPPQWAETLAEHMELLRSQVAPVAELHSLWADVGHPARLTGRDRPDAGRGPAAAGRAARGAVPGAGPGADRDPADPGPQGWRQGQRRGLAHAGPLGLRA